MVPAPMDTAADGWLAESTSRPYIVAEQEVSCHPVIG